MNTPAKTNMLETFAVSDTFVSGLGEIEHLGGGVYRFTFYTRQHVGERDELIVSAKIVMPMEAVPPALAMTAKMVGYDAVRFVAKAVN
jgi:hypothetical protein